MTGAMGSELGRITFVFETLCSADCVLYFMVVSEKVAFKGGFLSLAFSSSVDLFMQVEIRMSLLFFLGPSKNIKKCLKEFLRIVQ